MPIIEGNGHCPNCGELLSGDGWTMPLHCPNTEENIYEMEADAYVPCRIGETADTTTREDTP